MLYILPKTIQRYFCFQIRIIKYLLLPRRTKPEETALSAVSFHHLQSFLMYSPKVLPVCNTIKQIQELAEALTPVSDIAALLDIDENELREEINYVNSPVRRAYNKGKAKTALALRKQELELARVGSPLAVQLTATYIKDMTIDE